MVMFIDSEDEDDSDTQIDSVGGNGDDYLPTSVASSNITGLVNMPILPPMLDPTSIIPPDTNLQQPQQQFRRRDDGKGKPRHVQYTF